MTDMEAILPVVIPAIVIGLQLLRRGRPVPVDPRRLWLLPAFLVPFLCAGLYFQPHAPYTPGAYVGMALALAIGIAVGVVRGRSVRLYDDGGRLMMQPTSLDLLVFAALFAVRYLVHLWAERTGAGLDPGTFTHALILFALGMILTRRMIIWRRARPSVTHRTP